MYFNCSQENPSVEKCGVPHSCCRIKTVSAHQVTFRVNKIQHGFRIHEQAPLEPRNVKQRHQQPWEFTIIHTNKQINKNKISDL